MGTLTINNSACNVVIYPVEYGLLYNWYAAMDSREISSSDDWIVPSSTQVYSLQTYLGGQTVAGGKLKETGTTYWKSPNTGATNETGFNGRGSGSRSANGAFSGVIDEESRMWCSDPNNNFRLLYNTATFSNYTAVQKTGTSVRLLYVGSGTPTMYVGNDGKYYRIILIGTQYWMADNLAETRFRNGDIIPWYGASTVDYFTAAEWAALTTSGACAHNNDVNNVSVGFTFPS